MPSTSAADKPPLDIVVSFRAERSLTVIPEDPLRHYIGLIMLDESGAVGVDGPVIGEIEAMRLLVAEAEVEPDGLAGVFDRYSDDLLAYYEPLRDARLFDDLLETSSSSIGSGSSPSGAGAASDSSPSPPRSRSWDGSAGWWRSRQLRPSRER